MALINCPECNREISDKAASCPGCGAPVQSTTTTSATAKVEPPMPSTIPAAAEPLGTPPPFPSPANRPTTITGIQVVGLVLACVGGVAIYVAGAGVLDQHSGLATLVGFLVLWGGLILGIPTRSPIVRFGGTFFAACLALALPAMLSDKSSSSTGSSSTGVAPAALPPKPKTPSDEAVDVLQRELDAQRRGDACADCWAPDGERTAFKNLIEYSLKSTFTCQRKGQDIPGVLGVSFRGKAQNGYGAELWDDYEALVVKVAGSWRLASITKVGEVAGQKLDMCMLAGVTGLLNKYGGATPPSASPQ